MYRLVPGWLEDAPDSRDHLYQKAGRPLSIPNSVDLRDRCPPIETQGRLGSCTAQALVGALEFLLKREEKPHEDLSRLFLYYLERLRMGTVNQDSGAYLRIGIKVLQKTGVCDETLWPYEVSKFTESPPQNSYDDADQRKIVSYQRILSQEERLQCLSEGYPFVFGFTVFASFESKSVARTGVVHMPRKCSKKIGGHAVMAVGYDLNSNRFIVRNSWGGNWGQDGYFTIPFEFIEKYARDFWVIYR